MAALVKQTVGSSGGTSATNQQINFTSTGGNLLVLLYARGTGASAYLSSITDVAGNTWTLAALGAQSGSFHTHLEVWYAQNAAATTRITANASGTATNSWVVLEFSGIVTTSALDAASPQTGAGSSSTVTSPSVTTHDAATVVLAAAHFQSCTTTGPGSPWTSTSDFDDSAGGSGRAAYRVVASAGSYSAAWGLWGTPSPSGSATVAFTAATAATTPVTGARASTWTDRGAVTSSRASTWQTAGTAVTVIDKYNNAEGGVDGATVTAGAGGNSGGASGDYYSAIPILGAAGSTCTFDSAAAHAGSLGYKLSCVSGGAVKMQMLASNTAKTFRVRRYLRFRNTLPADTTILIQFYNAVSSVLAQLSVMAGPVFRGFANGVQLGSDSGGVAAGTWYRVEITGTVGVSAVTGQITFNVYVGESATPFWTATSSGCDLGVDNVNFVNMGKNSTGAFADVIDVDGDAFGDSSTVPYGPTGGAVTGSRASTWAVSAIPAGTRLDNTAEGVNGATVTTGNTSGPDQFTAVTVTGSGTTAKFSTAHAHAGTTSVNLHYANVASTCYLEWSGLTATPNVYCRAYLYMTAVPASSPRLFTIISGTSTRGQARLNSSGLISVVDSSGITVGSTTAIPPVNAWCRIELDLTGMSGTTGNAQFRLYSGSNLEGTTPDSGGTVTVSGMTTNGSDADGVRVGAAGSTTMLWDQWLDDLAYSDTAQPGPVFMGVVKTVASATAASGSVFRAPAKRPAGVTAGAGGTVKSGLVRALTGLVTPVGVKYGVLGRRLYALVVPAGVTQRGYPRTVSGSVVAAATLSRRLMGRFPAGAVTAVGSLRRGFARTVTATVTGQAPSPKRFTAKRQASVSSPLGIAGRVAIRFRTYTGQITAAGLTLHRALAVKTGQVTGAGLMKPRSVWKVPKGSVRAVGVAVHVAFQRVFGRAGTATSTLTAAAETDTLIYQRQRAVITVSAVDTAAAVTSWREV